MKVLCIGDTMIPGKNIAKAAKELQVKPNYIEMDDWETDWNKLQDRRLVIEKQGPSAEKVVPQIANASKDIEILLVLFCPVSQEAIETLPELKLIGASRAGLENIDVDYATKKGIVVHNIQGRNAQAVSDYTIGLILAEARNIARSHTAVKNGIWRKNFFNSDMIPELQGKTVGLIGFGFIGQLVAQKLSGFRINLLVFDPYVNDDDIQKYQAKRVSLEDLLKNSDFISLHARLSQENKDLLGEKELSCMKKSAYLINTARAGLIQEDALFESLKGQKIAGAALDVFWQEPITKNSRWLTLDNVTLTSHIAGTTTEALTKSPFLLVQDINRLLEDNHPRFIVNPEVLEKIEVQKWLEKVRRA
ncbi:MAG TPA: 3-phosphoglycerate dehydrogenase [Caldithrix sp.]|nr:3-phosphoglycerate dehydrogenase [Caldithrix sp.]HER24091.1 3-phosphoglycerate dehydrogenase [Candidatus Atribacteria bacterium]